MLRENYLKYGFYRLNYADTFFTDPTTENKDKNIQEVQSIFAWDYLVNIDKKEKMHTKTGGFPTEEKNETKTGIEDVPFLINNQTMTTVPTQYTSKEKQLREDAQKKSYIRTLLKNDIYELGTISELQTYIEKQLIIENEQYVSTNFQKILEEIYLEEFQNPSIFVNFLQIISQIDYKLIYPTGPIMALAATRHENCEVREYGLRCYENWEDPSCLSILKSLHFEEEWLQNYLNMLISALEEGD